MAKRAAPDFGGVRVVGDEVIEVVGAHPGDADASAPKACGLCASMHGTTARYARTVLCNLERREANAEAIADALGFCPAHAAFVAGLDDHGAEIGAVMRHAILRTRMLLDAGPGKEDRLLEVFFGAANACPACRYAERQLTGFLLRHASFLRSSGRDTSQSKRPLCLPHFLSLIGVSEKKDLLPWAGMEFDLLSKVTRTLDAAGPSAVLAATRLVAGYPEATRAFLLKSAAPLLDDAGCTVCVAMRRAFFRWLEAVRESIRIDAAPWTLLGTCPEHIWACALVGDSEMAARATRHALEVALRTLRRAAVKLEQEDRRLEAEARSVWFKRKSPAYLLGQQRNAITKMPRCFACERIAVARDRAIAELIERMREKRHREAFEREFGLCMKHFALARVIAPAGTVRDFLTDIYAAKLRSLELELAGAATGASPWKEAICRFSGHM